MDPTLRPGDERISLTRQADEAERLRGIAERLGTTLEQSLARGAAEGRALRAGLAAAAALGYGVYHAHDPGAPAGSRQARNRLLTRRALERVRADALRFRRG